MVSRGACVALAVLATASASGTASGQSPRQEPTDNAVVVTGHRTFQASIERISNGSALWREAVDVLRKTGRRALILTPDQVVVKTVGDGGTDALDVDLLAEVAPVAGDDGRIDLVLVVVNLPLLEEMHRNRFSPPSEFQDDVDRILIHELYGHALPYLVAGNLSGRCPDPKRNQRAADACAIQRENAVRAELGLGRRTEYGLIGLALARPTSH